MLSATMDERYAVRRYESRDELAWLRCRVLSFMATAFFDDVLREKERYEHAAIELVVECGGEIVGLIDVECDDDVGAVCSDRPGLGAMIWHVAVHPDHQGRGLATSMLQEVIRLTKALGIARIEAWTRDDAPTRSWYESRGFTLVDSYLHVYIELDEGLRDLFPITQDGLRPVRLFAREVGIVVPTSCAGG